MALNGISGFGPSSFPSIAGGAGATTQSRLVQSIFQQDMFELGQPIPGLDPADASNFKLKEAADKTTEHAQMATKMSKSAHDGIMAVIQNIGK